MNFYYHEIKTHTKFNNTYMYTNLYFVNSISIILPNKLYKLHKLFSKFRANMQYFSKIYGSKISCEVTYLNYQVTQGSG